MRRLSLFLAAALVAVPPPVTANPVATEVADYFNVLVAATAARHCPDYETLVRDFGRFGLDLLTKENRAAIATKFDRFAGILVYAQRPGHQLSHDIELLFLAHASEAQQRRYCDALLEWMTAEMDRAPASGSLIIEHGPSELPRVINWHRACAAQILADFGDARVVAEIHRLLANAELDDKTRRLLERTKLRFGYPCVTGLVAPNGKGELLICVDVDDVKHLELGRKRLDESEISLLVELLRDAEWIRMPPRAKSAGATIRLKLENDAMIVINQRSDDSFRVREVDSPYRREWDVASPDLAVWVESKQRTER